MSVLAVLLVLALCVVQHVSADPTSIAVYSTVPLNTSVRLSPQPSLTFNKSCPTDLPTLTVTSTGQQPLLGFGAALTETTAYNFALLKQRNLSAYTELLTSLFAPYPDGIAISWLRIPITSSDLSLPTPGWSYDDTPGDFNLTSFNSSHGEAYQIPILQDIVALSSSYNTQLRLLGSPWSAPAWIKDSQAWGYGTIMDVDNDGNSYYDWYDRIATDSLPLSPPSLTAAITALLHHPVSHCVTAGPPPHSPHLSLSTLRCVMLSSGTRATSFVSFRRSARSVCLCTLSHCRMSRDSNPALTQARDSHRKMSPRSPTYSDRCYELTT